MTRKIPSTMVSQHPDHAGKPYWHTEEFISTQHETFECFLSFSELGVSEYKWDWEGKLVDESVMERLLSQYYEFFKTHPLGYDKFLTFRLPNPKVETEFRIGRAFMGILSADMIARQYGFYSPPLFEVILPMTTSAKAMIEVQEAFREIASLKHQLYRMSDRNLRHIELIPLFEDVETIMNSDKILDAYLKMHKKQFKFRPSYMRPYVARSDPALNAGIVPTVLAIKVALSKYKDFSEKEDIALYPIIGSASLPFRGGLTPLNVESFANEYKGIKTALIQSAFRYDYGKKDVLRAVKKLEKLLPSHQAVNVTPQEEKEIREMVVFFEEFYRPVIEGIAEQINAISSMLPRRRERVQHIGLFGYSRGVGKVKLPRAIGFTAALYSLGVPPELIGTGRGLQKSEKLGYLMTLEKHYVNIKEDLKRAGRYLNKKNLHILSKQNSAWKAVETDVKVIEKYVGALLGPKSKEEKQHNELTTEIVEKLDEGTSLAKLIQDAAVLRKSLG